MKLVEARAAARKLWPTLDLRLLREGTYCVLRRDGELFGRGGSWLECLRDAALRFTKCEDVDALRTKAKEQTKAAT